MTTKHRKKKKNLSSILTEYALSVLTCFCHLLPTKRNNTRLKIKAASALSYCKQHNMNTRFCILADYSLHPGKNRLFVWSFHNEQIVFECPASHGQGHNEPRKAPIRFSNIEESWLSSIGKCRIAERYEGMFGTAYRLDGLDNSNYNIRKRCIVLHGDHRIPSMPIYPFRPVRSKGCVMVSHKSLRILDEYLHNEKSILLEVFD